LEYWKNLKQEEFALARVPMLVVGTLAVRTLAVRTLAVRTLAVRTVDWH